MKTLKKTIAILLTVLLTNFMTFISNAAINPLLDDNFDDPENLFMGWSVTSGAGVLSNDGGYLTLSGKSTQTEKTFTTTSGIIYAEMKIKSGPSTSAGPTIFVRNGGGSMIQAVLLSNQLVMQNVSNDTFNGINSGNKTVVSGLSASTWYCIRFVLNTETKRVDTYLGTSFLNMTKGATYNFLYNATNGVQTAANKLLFYSNASNTTISFDEIKVYTISAEAPVASNVCVGGTPYTGGIAKINYTYFDANGDIESNSEFSWELSDNSDFSDETIVSTSRTYEISENDSGKFLRGSIIPKTTVAPMVGDKVYTNIIYIQDKYLYFNEDFENGTAGWETSSTGVVSVVEENGNKFVSIENGEISKNLYGNLSLDSNDVSNLTIDLQVKTPESGYYIFDILSQDGATKVSRFIVYAYGIAFQNEYADSKNVVRPTNNSANQLTTANSIVGGTWLSVRLNYNMQNQTVDLYYGKSFDALETWAANKCRFNWYANGNSSFYYMSQKSIAQIAFISNAPVAGVDNVCAYVSPVTRLPELSDISTAGEPKTLNRLTGTYQAASPQGGLYYWVVAKDEIIGDSVTAMKRGILAPNEIASYTVSTDDFGKYLAFVVVPKKDNSVFGIGLPVVYPMGQVTGLSANNFGVYKDNSIISELGTGGQISAKATLANNDAAIVYDAVLVLAHYNGDTLKDIKISPKVTLENGVIEELFTDEITVDEIHTNENVKAFLLTGLDNLNPISLLKIN